MFTMPSRPADAGPPIPGHRSPVGPSRLAQAAARAARLDRGYRRALRGIATRGTIVDATGHYLWWIDNGIYRERRLD